MQTLEITVKLTLKAAKNEITGWEQGPEGEEKHLKVKVTAVPEKNQANKALIALLAKHIGIPKSNIQIIRGHQNRQKTIRIQWTNQESLYDSIFS